MEYRRDRRRRQKSRGGEGLKTFTAILMLAAIIYLLSSTALGGWAKEKLLSPGIEAVKGLFFPAESSSSEAEANEEKSLRLSEQRSAVSLDLSLPAVYCCALQMGVYADMTNAQKQAESLQSMGAGGYILEDAEGRYRVLAAGYATDAEAMEVKERLKADGTDCTVFSLQADPASFRISADARQLDAVEAAFSAVSDAQSALTDAALNFDRSSLSVAEGKKSAEGILQALEENFSPLKAYTGESVLLLSLLACYENCADAISVLLNSPATDPVAFSADFKYAQLYVTDQYASLMASIHGN